MFIRRSAGVRTGIGIRDASAGCGAQVKLNFHIFQIESEYENVLVLDGRSLVIHVPYPRRINQQVSFHLPTGIGGKKR